MSGNLSISGSLQAGPTCVTDGGFPTMTANAGLQTKSSPKAYIRSTGILSRTEQFSSFTDLGEPGHTVNEVHTLYFRSNGPVELRLTTDDGAGGDVQSVVPVDGLFIAEFDIATDNGKFLKLLELSTLGSSVQFEYLLAGNA